MQPDPRTEFMQAYAPCHEAFSRYCAALAFGRIEVEDLMQDVLLTAFRQFDRIRRKDQLLHYLIRAARNRAASEWRLAARTEALREKQLAHIRDKGTPAEVLVDVGLLYAELDKLPAKQREALVLFEVSGLSMEEIAAIQGVKANAVKTRVSRARTTLRETLEAQARPQASNLLNTMASLML